MRAPPPCQEKVRRVRFTPKQTHRCSRHFCCQWRSFSTLLPSSLIDFHPKQCFSICMKTKKWGRNFFVLMALFLDSGDQNRTTKSNFPPDWRRRSVHDTWRWKHPTAAQTEQNHQQNQHRAFGLIFWQVSFFCQRFLWFFLHSNKSRYSSLRRSYVNYKIFLFSSRPLQLPVLLWDCKQPGRFLLLSLKVTTITSDQR